MCGNLQMGNSKYIKDIEIFRGDFLSFTFKFYNSLQVFKQFYLFILHFHILCMQLSYNTITKYVMST